MWAGNRTFFHHDDMKMNILSKIQLNTGRLKYPAWIFGLQLVKLLVLLCKWNHSLQLVLGMTDQSSHFYNCQLAVKLLWAQWVDLILPLFEIIQRGVFTCRKMTSPIRISYQRSFLSWANSIWNLIIFMVVFIWRRSGDVENFMVAVGPKWFDDDGCRCMGCQER